MESTAAEMLEDVKVAEMKVAEMARTEAIAVEDSVVVAEAKAVAVSSVVVSMVMAEDFLVLHQWPVLAVQLVGLQSTAAPEVVALTLPAELQKAWDSHGLGPLPRGMQTTPASPPARPAFALRHPCHGA